MLIPHARILWPATLILALTTAQAQNPASNAEAAGAVSATLQGRVEALVVDNFEAGTSRTRFFLHTSRETVELQGTETTSLRPGQLVKITGRLAGSRLMISQVSLPQAAAATGSCPTTGALKSLIILASYPSKPLLSSVTPQLMRDSFFGTGRTVDGFIRESSFGQASVTGDVVGPYVLDADYFDQPMAARDAAVRAASPSVSLAQYSRIFVVGPQGGLGMDSGGMALIGCGTISSPQGDLFASSIWLGGETMVAQNTVVEVAAHELGHGLGLEHARWADYGSEPLGPVGQTGAPWDSTHDYGDTFSNMGRKSGQWSAPQKALLGWLQTGTNIQTVTSDGTFNLLPYEAQGSGQALRVRRDADGQAWLWIEYRQPQGTFDATLPSEAFAGALVHYEDPALKATESAFDAAGYSNLVNFHPTEPYAVNPTLHAGEAWADPYGNLSLTVNSATAAGLNLSVSYAPASSCPSSVGGGQSFDAAGGSGVVPITAASGCAWTAIASVPWITVGSPGAGTGAGSVGFSVAANPNVSPRWGKITVGSAFMVVTQAGGTGWVTISPHSAAFSAAGGTGQIAVGTSSPDMAWTTGWDATWITSVDCTCILMVGPATLRYTVAANAGPARNATLTINGVPFAITQDAGAPVPGSLTWTQLTPQDAPPARIWQTMAPFSNSGQALLYGGAWDTSVLADTWTWDGTNWTLLHPSHNPGQLAEQAMAYDAARGNIVLFGGSRADGSFSGETWIWNGTDWQQVHPAASPSPRFGHAMAYDPTSQSVLLFGGDTESGQVNDTWTWNGTNWSQVTTSAAPMPRDRPGMTFDAARGRVVLFGGYNTRNDTLTSDTWVYDAAGWHQALTATPPPGRIKPLLVYHPGLHAVVMVGGVGGKGPDNKNVSDTLKETWLWNGTAWAQQFPENQPGPAYTLGAVWDESKQGLIVQVGDDLTCASRGPKTYLLTGAKSAQPLGLRFMPVTPCRIADTRNAAGAFGGPSIPGGTPRSFAVPQSACGIPATAQAYSLNVTALPQGTLSYLTLWPSGQTQPLVSTLNSFSGDVVANAAIVPAGTGGAVSVFVSNTADVILDINGYFDLYGGAEFNTATPCRIADTRDPAGTFGGPRMAPAQSRDFPVPLSSCDIPPTASASSLNFTVVPDAAAHYLGYLSTWPAGRAQPNVSTLNSWTGKVVANAAIVPAGDGQAVSVFVSNSTDTILDINGYFGQPNGTAGLLFYPVSPCRIADTRNPDGPFGGPVMQPGARSFTVPQSACNIPSTAAAYSVNVTVVPGGPLSYLTAWPTGATQPYVSTLNAQDGAVVANAAIIPAGAGGAISIFVTNPTHVIIDINGYFAP